MVTRTQSAGATEGIAQQQELVEALEEEEARIQRLEAELAEAIPRAAALRAAIG